MNDAPARNDTVTLDPENPWLGLFSYTEETRAYFHGRDEETAELARRVQRALLTVLFGQSGLGKTSLLRAGLVPRLRKEGYCPVYVRIDYAPGSPTASEQIKQSVFRATAAAGHWTRPGSAVAGEPLWEFLHHRGDLLRDADGRTLTPLLIFDQFEEIFTLGQADDAGKLRAKQFLEDLADLVENRAPAELEARLENDDSAIEDFDFARADYRVLIALREDYLAHLEGLKGTMPSITQNRMRLARMNGAQALSAVVKPGGKLVSQEVAEAIVRFVAGGSELANAEIEPSLLSLVCRELNVARQTQHRKEISADLLAGSRDTILTEFYERALADQPEGVRRVVEDELLTESGYRESLAEERVLKALAASGAAPDALATLVNRRLLRIEERLDMRRVELTHDVLCGVVQASREQRHAREAKEAAERELAAQREREAATHRALHRAQLIAAVCAVLLLLAIAGGVFGYFSTRRAHTAEAEAQAARTHAEGLVSFLIEDFYNQLAPTGRLETLGALAQKTVSYYDSLPPELVTRQTQINRAMALVREGSAQIASGNQKAADKSFGDAQAAFEKLRAAGDDGEPVTYGLALILYNQNYAGATGGGRTAPMDQAAALLRPLVNGPNPSRRARQLYADTLNIVCLNQRPQQGLATCDEALKTLEGLGALDLSDLNASASWADTADTKSGELQALGRIDEAQKLEQQVFAMTEKVLAHRPGDLHALEDRFFAASRLALLASGRHDATGAMGYANQTVQAAQDWVRFNPSSLDAWSRWAQALAGLAGFQYENGEVSKAFATGHSALALTQDPRSPKGFAAANNGLWRGMAQAQASSGDSAGAEQSLQAFLRNLRAFSTDFLAPDSPQRQLADNQTNQLLTDSQMKLSEGNPQAALAEATAAHARIESIEVPKTDAGTAHWKNQMLGASFDAGARAAVRLNHYAQAEILARQWLAIAPNSVNTQTDPKPLESRARSILAQAIAMQGRRDEASKMLQPALAYYAGEQKAGAQETNFRHDYAYALYVDAIAQPAGAAGAKQRKDDLDQAAKLIAGASQEVQQLSPFRYLSGLIAAAR
ncbi:MAG: ATP-binding protein [Proteobacteria bacterium]|nr:ATP-binding protein [Pseudomonadota bacterium]